MTDPSGPNAHLNARPRTYLYLLRLEAGRAEAEGLKGGQPVSGLAGGEAERVTVLGDVQSAHWSPDSSRLLIFSSPLQRYAVTKARRLFLPGGLRPRRRKERQAARALAESAVVAMSVLDLARCEADDGPGAGGLVSEIVQWIKPSAAMKDFLKAERQGQPHASSPVRARGSLWSPSSDAVCWAGCCASRQPDTGDVLVHAQEGVWVQRVGGSRDTEGQPSQGAEGSAAGEGEEEEGEEEDVAPSGVGNGAKSRGMEALLIHERGSFALWSHS